MSPSFPARWRRSRIRCCRFSCETNASRQSLPVVRLREPAASKKRGRHSEPDCAYSHALYMPPRRSSKLFTIAHPTVKIWRTASVGPPPSSAARTCCAASVARDRSWRPMPSQWIRCREADEGRTRSAVAPTSRRPRRIQSRPAATSPMPCSAFSICRPESGLTRPAVFATKRTRTPARTGAPHTGQSRRARSSGHTGR